MRKNRKKRILALGLAMCLSAGLVPENNVLAANPQWKNEESKEAHKKPEKTEEKEAEEQQIEVNEISTQIQDIAQNGITQENEQQVAELKLQLIQKQETARYASNKLINEWLEVASGYNGKFTIGTVEGNPNYSSDNNKKLLFGHPYPSTSETLIMVDGMEHYFSADTVVKSGDGTAYVATMNVEDTGIIVTQTLSFHTNSATGRADTVKISYDVRNSSGAVHQVGIRIMLDTMLASNDAAPFKIAGYGNVTTAKVLTGSAVTQTYQVYDNLDAPSTMAAGTLWLGKDRHPDKVQYCNWAGIKGSRWNHNVSEGDYLGDSAVGIYYNPVTIPAGGATAVSTYYGTGIGLGGSDEITIPVEDEIGSNDFDVYITDARTGKAVSTATVTIEGIGSVVTNAKGAARFKSLEDNKNGQMVNLTVERAGYRAKTTTVKVMLGSSKTILVRGEDDTLPMVDSVMMTSADTKYNDVDLLSSTVYFNSNPDNVEAGKNNTQEVVVTAKASTNNENETCVYQLISDGKVVMENDSGEFRLKTLTGDNHGKTYTTNRLCGFSEGNKVYLQAVSPAGELSQKTLLGISVSAPSFSAVNLKTNASFVENISFGSLEDAKELVEILLGSDIDGFEVSDFPLELEVDNDGKVKVAYNKGKDVNFDTFRGNYDKAVLRTAGALKNFGGKTGSIGAGNAKVGLDLAGYGEGYFKDGVLNVKLGIIGTVSGSASYTQTFFVGFVPLYIKVGADAEASLQVAGSVISDGKLSLKITEGKFEPAFSLYAELGAGVSGVLSAGVQGRGTLQYSADFLRDYYKLTIKGKASVEVHALLYSTSIDLAEATWTLYDSKRQRTSQKEESADAWYDGDSFQFTERIWQDAKRAGTKVMEEWDSGVYVDAKPVMVKVGTNTYYRFWISDSSKRSDANYTSLVYSKYDADTGNWSEPTILDDNNTPDYNCNAVVSGTDIYLVYQESGKEYTQQEYEEFKSLNGAEGIAAMVKDCQVSMIKLDTTSNTVTNFGKISENSQLGALSPHISIKGNEAMAAWYSNSKNNILGGENANEDIGENTIYYSKVSLASGAPVGTIGSFTVGEGVLTSMDIGNLDGKQQIAYVLDTDQNLITVADRELYLASGLDMTVDTRKITKETANAMMDENPVFANIGGNDSLIWYEGGNYYYTSGTVEEKQAVFHEKNIPNNANNGYAVLEDGIETAIVWMASSSASNGEERYTSLYGTKLTDGIWSGAYEMSQVSEIENPMADSLSGVLEDGLCKVSFALKKYEEGTVQISSLCGAMEEEITAAEITDISYDLNQAKSGEQMDLEVTLKNIGTKMVEQAELFVGSSSTEMDAVNLQPGQEKTYTVPVMLPETEDSENYLVTLAVGNADPSHSQWRYAAERSFEVSVNYTDVSVTDGVRTITGNGEYYTFLIKNESQVPAENVNLKLILDNEENGAVAYEYRKDRLEPGESYTLFCPGDVLQESTVAYKRLTTSTSEMLTGNNSGIICINTQIPDVIEKNILQLKSDNEAAGTVECPEGFEESAGIYQKNCDTNEEIQVQAVPKEGFAFIRWEIEGKGSVTDKFSAQTTYYMGDADTTITAVFATENHMTGLTIPESISVEYGEIHKFIPELTPTDSSDHIIWSSEDEEIAAVDEDGLLTAKAVGSTQIMARSSAENGVEAVCQVTVTEVMLSGLRMVFPNLELAGIGVSEDLRILKTPQNATEKIIYTSNHPEYVTVNENGAITTKAAGTAVITATGEKSGKNASCTVTVTVPLTGIYFPNSMLNMLTGETKQIAYSENPVNTTDSPDPADIVWTCSNKNIVELKLSEDHRLAEIKALKSGTATISVSIGENFHASCTVNVKQLINKISLSESNIRISRGKSRYLNPSIFPTDAEGTIYWSSSDSKVASVSSSGKVTGVNAGSAVITAQPDTNCPPAKCTVTIYADEVTVTSVNGFESNHNYENNMDKTWIYTDKNASALHVAFNKNCMVEKKYDHIYIYDGNGAQVGVYTGSELASQNIAVTGNTIKVRMVTDYSGTNYGFKVDAIQPIYQGIEKAQVSVASCTYTGKKIQPMITVKLGGTVLAKNKDYIVTYTNNINAGKGKVTITGKGKYSGIVKKEFTISKRKLTKNHVSEIYNMVYTGKTISAKPKVTVDKKVLRLKKDYTLSYSNNKKAGKKAVVKIKGSGNYTGSVSITFAIVKKENAITAKNTSIKVKGNKAYTGKEIKPSITVKRNGKQFSAKNYKIIYHNNKNIGKATITIRGKGNYGGSISISFDIVPKATSISKVTCKKKGAATVEYKKITGASGYKIYYAKKQNGTYKEVGKTSKTSYTILKLKKGTVYYVKVRSYKTIGKKTYYGAYSKARKVKVNK